MDKLVHCRDCKNASQFMIDGLDGEKPCQEGMLNCNHFSEWDYYNDVPGHWLVEPDGFCAWGELIG